MASTIENTLKKVGNTIEYIMGKRVNDNQPTSNSSGTGQQSNLEMYGIEARKVHLFRNEWKKDLQYTKALVNSEYSIQTEFEVGTTDEDIVSQMAEQEKKAAEKQAKAKKKADKKAEKEAKKATKVAGTPTNAQPGGQNTKTAPIETLD